MRIRTAIEGMEVNRVVVGRSYAIEPPATMPDAATRAYRAGFGGGYGVAPEVAVDHRRRAWALRALAPRAGFQPVAAPREVKAAASWRRLGIEDLLHWVYAVQRADLIEGFGIGLQDAEAEADGIVRARISGDGCGFVERLGRLGCRVDGGGYRSGRLHVDAETVHERVLRLPQLTRGLIVSHARAGTRPKFSAARPKLVPVLNGKGRPVLDYDRNRNPVSCRLAWTVDPVKVEALNAAWSAWRQGLDDVVAMLAEAELVNHGVVGTTLAWRPWEEVG